MALAHIYCDSIPLRNATTDEREIGLDVWLLPEGGTAPGELIQLTPNAGLPWYYDFPAQVVNGLYDLYTGPAGSQVPVKHNGEQVQVRVMRGGNVDEGDTTFVKDW